MLLRGDSINEYGKSTITRLLRVITDHNGQEFDRLVRITERHSYSLPAWMITPRSKPTWWWYTGRVIQNAIRRSVPSAAERGFVHQQPDRRGSFLFSAFPTVSP
jgi:hypothetical protein